MQNEIEKKEEIRFRKEGVCSPVRGINPLIPISRDQK